MIEDSFEPELKAWQIELKNRWGITPRRRWSASKEGETRWRASLTLTGGPRKRLHAVWLIRLPLDRNPTPSELDEANENENTIEPINRGARRLSKLPPPRVGRGTSVRLVASIMAVPPGGRSLQVSIVPERALDPGLVVRRGSDQALARGIRLLRNKTVPPVTIQRLASTARFVIEGLTQAKDRTLERSAFLRLAASRPQMLVLFEWKAAGKSDLDALLKRPTSEVRVPYRR